MIFCALKCKDSRISLWHVIAMLQYYIYSCTSKSSYAISNDTVTFTHVLRVLHFSGFLSHNLPYAFLLTPSTVQKTINSHSILHSSYSCHASVTTIQALHHSYSFQYSLITSCYKQLGCSLSPRMRHISY